MPFSKWCASTGIFTHITLSLPRENRPWWSPNNHLFFFSWLMRHEDDPRFTGLNASLDIIGMNLQVSGLRFFLFEEKPWNKKHTFHPHMAKSKINNKLKHLIYIKWTARKVLKLLPELLNQTHLMSKRCSTICIFSNVPYYCICI